MSETFELTEKYDLDKIGNILSSPALKTWVSGDLRRLQRLFYLARQHNGELNVKYYPNNKANVGRLNFKINDVRDNPYCMCSLSREIRGILAEKNYYDLDIVNAHPNILSQICKKYGVECPRLDYYCSHREECFNMFDCSRDQVKTLFISLMYGSTINKWLTDNQLPSSTEIPTFVTNFHNELHQVAKHLLTIPEFEYINKYYDSASYQKSHHKKYDNAMGCKLSFICQTYERKIILALMNIIVNDGYIVGSIIYDGLHIDKINGLIPTDTISNWCDKLYDATHFRLNLSLKEFNSNNIYYAEDSGFHVSDKHQYDFHSLTRTTYDYDIFKNMWEHISFKVIKQNVYGVYAYDGELITMDSKGLSERYSHLSYINEKGENSQFIPRWVKDPQIKIYASLELIFPNSKQCDDCVFNLWNGFAAENLHIEPYELSDEDNANIQFIRDYIRELTGDDCFEYVENWIADIFQNPGQKPYGAGMVLYSDIEGTGKDSLYELLKKMIGDKYCFHTPSPEKTLLGNFTKLRENKLLICLEETDPKVSFLKSDEIKAMMTCTHFACNEKQIKAYDSKCYERFIFTTNNSISLNISMSDRRFFVIECASTHIGDVPYWTKLYKLKDDEYTMFNLFNYYKNKPITMHIVGDKPMTNIKKRIQEANVPPFKKWFKEYVDDLATSTTPVDFTFRELFNNFLNWLKENNYQALASSTTSKRFGMDLKALYDPESKLVLNGLCRRKGDSLQITFNYKELKPQITTW